MNLGSEFGKVAWRAVPLGRVVEAYGDEGFWGSMVPVPDTVRTATGSATMPALSSFAGPMPNTDDDLLGVFGSCLTPVPEHAGRSAAPVPGNGGWGGATPHPRGPGPASPVTPRLRRRGRSVSWGGRGARRGARRG